MNRGQAEKYLFVWIIFGEFEWRFLTSGSVKALEKCNDEIQKRMGAYPYVRGLIGNFFNREKHTRKLSRQMTQELVDFWDVYGEFDSMLRPSAKRNYLILQML